MPLDLTPKQQQLFFYFEREARKTGKTPSLRQAAADMGVSHAAISQLIKALEKKGAVRRDGRYSRTVHLLNHSREAAGFMRFREIPILGRIAAGLPLYAQQEWDGTVVVDTAVYRAPGLFALKVAGDSMTGAAILHGDLAICEPRQFAENGEIVVALIHQEEATIKRFFLKKNRIELRPENPVYRAARYRFDEVLVQGKVVGIHRGPEGMAAWNPA